MSWTKKKQEMEEGIFLLQVVEVVCHCVGPVLFINAEKVDFGRIEALTPIQHAILLSNESPIPAQLTSLRVSCSLE